MLWHASMPRPSAPHNIIALSRLRPTQLTVGLLQVKHKRARLRTFEKRPAELVDFILEHPIRVVLGPASNAYVIDHHHLALALLKEEFETAPMEVEDDFSSLSLKSFWKKMQARHFLHLTDADGEKSQDIGAPQTHGGFAGPTRIASLAGFVRESGGFHKVRTPFAEFLWGGTISARK